MTAHHIGFPQLAAEEDEFNRILAARPLPDGTVRRVCMHVDRTVAHPVGNWWQTITSCDYCGETVYDSGAGHAPVLMPVEYLDRETM